MSLCKCVTSEFTIEHNNQYFPPSPGFSPGFPGFIAGQWVVNSLHFGFSDTAILIKKNLSIHYSEPSEIPKPLYHGLFSQSQCLI